MATDIISNASTSSSGVGPQNWSDLPDGLLHSILLRLSLTRDLLAFSSVCRSWRSFATSTMAASPTSLFPPLYIFPGLKHLSRRRRSIITSRLRLRDPAIIPRQAFRRTFYPSPLEESTLSCFHGHLLFLTRCRQITGFQITSPVLPLDHHLPAADSCLAQLTASVFSPDCTLIFLTVDFLFMWKINSPDWISCPLRVRLTKLRQMIHVGSRILVVGRKVWALEVGNLLELPQYLCPKELVVQCQAQNILPSFEKARVVDGEGEILFVCFTPSNRGTEYKVEVFRVDMFDDHMILVKKDDLGDRALFLSNVNGTGCVCNNPERWGGGTNLIYYANYKGWCLFEVGGFASSCSIYQVKHG